MMCNNFSVSTLTSIRKKIKRFILSDGGMFMSERICPIGGSIVRHLIVQIRLGVEMEWEMKKGKLSKQE